MSEIDEEHERFMKQVQEKQELEQKQEEELLQSISNIEDEKWRVFLRLLYEIKVALIDVKSEIEDISIKMDSLS
jgi:hypothetical protein